MDPAYEQRLREEVIYLHSLWHQGPPTPRNPNPNFLHHITNPTQFKKQRNRPFGKLGITQTEYRDSGIEWPCKPTPNPPPENDAGWPSFRPKSNSEPGPITPEQQARLVSNQAQKAALEAVTEFLSNRDNADDEDEDRDIDDAAEGEGCGKCEFFEKLFEEDWALREYYEKNNAGGGEFTCLVCYAVGKRSWKKYKDCVALVQHSVSIAKTKGRRAHRSYGQAICNVLGWDINRLPSSMVSTDNKESNNGSGTINDPKGSASDEDVGANNGESAQSEGNINNHVKDDSQLPDSVKSTNNENLQDSVGSIVAVLEEPAKEDTGIA